jgi:5-methylthioadenosine/S-adenosylhomocysteine deaminase
MADLIIRGGLVITMNGPNIENGVVVVEDGKITSVGRDTAEKADSILDAKGAAVMPGLINAHTHLPMTLFRGLAGGLAYKEWITKIQGMEMKLKPADVRAGTSLGILEMIKSGTTAFADMYIYMDEVAQAVEKAGIRAALGYGMIEGIGEDSESKLKTREMFARKWMGTAGISVMYAPHSVASCSKEFLMKVREMASRDGLRIHIHILETEDELHSMKKKYGMCSMNLLESIRFLGPDILAAHCIWVSDGDIEILKNRKVSVVHCPSSNMALGAGIAPVPRMLEKGINVALGTDGAASGGSLDMWKEMKIAQLIQEPGKIHPSVVLKMATVNGAKALGINAGVLQPGHSADIILIDLKKPHLTSCELFPSLANSATGCDVKTTIVAGNILMEDYRVELDEEKIIEDAKETILNIRENNILT